MPISMNNTTLTFNNGTTMTTAATGTVSSVATGNGLQGGTITSSGTLSVACPGFNTVGSYCFAVYQGNPSSAFNYSAGGGGGQVRSFSFANSGDGSYYAGNATNNLSGTWKWMAGNGGTSDNIVGVACRVS